MRMGPLVWGPPDGGHTRTMPTVDDRGCLCCAGGIGSRFWPLSKTKKPKQFLDILGTGKTQGSTQGDSRSAVFGMDIEATNFEFENYFFGDLKTKMNYKSF